MISGIMKGLMPKKMIIKEIFGDLFGAPDNFYFVHCISADFALGVGIAKEFSQRKNMREKLNIKYGLLDKVSLVGSALLVDDTFNLVTKYRYFQKPTYRTLKESLIDLKDKCISLGVNNLAMPRIGCGLDRLNWVHVKKIISDVFSDTDIKIYVYRLL